MTIANTANVLIVDGQLQVAQFMLEILLKVMKLSNRPEALMDPFAIAEILYSSGHLVEAAPTFI